MTPMHLLLNEKASVQRYFQAGLAPATQKTYSTAMNRFNNFCVKCMITDPFPVSELLLCSFAAYLADEGLAPQTVKTYLASVRNTQLSLGPREGSSLPILKRGISRLKGTKSRVRLPITIHILRAVQAHLHTASFPDREAIAATAFFRLGELIQPRNTH